MSDYGRTPYGAVVSESVVRRPWEVWVEVPARDALQHARALERDLHLFPAEEAEKCRARIAELNAGMPLTERERSLRDGGLLVF